MKGNEYHACRLQVGPSYNIAKLLRCCAGHQSFNDNAVHDFDAVLNLSTISVMTPTLGGVDIISEKV